MVMLGAHMSIAGGFHKAVEAAAKFNMDVVQIFTAAPQQWPVQATKTVVQSGGLLTKNNSQWRAKPISDDDVARFRQSLTEGNVAHPLSHASYLINCASPDDALWKRSIEALVVELQRAERLGIPCVVFHPGSFTTSSFEAGVKRIAMALDEVHRQTRGLKAQLLLETTAGQGNDIGWRFEHQAEILARVKDPDRLGSCFDTCHVFAAGYPLAEARDYRRTLREFDKLVGLDRIRAFHLNDSKRELGSRRDRHEHIGRGKLGLEAFRNLLNDRRFRRTPMYLETNKGTENGEDLDAVNLRTLRGLVAAPPKGRRQGPAK